MIIHAYSSKFKSTKNMHNDKSLLFPITHFLGILPKYFMYLEAKYK